MLAQRGWLYRPRIGTEHRHWHHPVEGAITLSGNMAHECDPAQEDAVLRCLGLTHVDLRPDLCKTTSKQEAR
ncbi:hypothetical protein E7T06_05740 [Deinococcus sp. Arct2-2]|uniref:hypothetical protein n=1 Tax=Deinococcus sp. Arct2-2 TaxID=2568653 RepID=UPI0010A4F3F8|nr:hypothetical protein [Deinococcus sp. Arct2-2]THF70847.1 hypothetical protein E7T06_05740 [Deinococcus sp. Arct2-2]